MKENTLYLLPNVWIRPGYYVYKSGINLLTELDEEEREKFEKAIEEGGFTLKITYPLHNPAVFEVPKEVLNAYFLDELVDFICLKYNQIYQEEEEGLSEEDLEPKGNLLNRPATNGKYGIWGHEIGDLLITEIFVDLETKEISLMVES